MFACQGFYGVFGLLALAGAASIGVSATPTAATPAPATLSVDVEAWSPRPFADVVLAMPELAACHYLAPGSWAAARPATSLTAPDALAGAVRAQLQGVLAPGAPVRFTVVVAEGEEAALSAVASGTTVLLFVPGSTPWTVPDAARVVISALARAYSMPAASDPRCSEPLLAVGEAVAVAGSLTLALLPPELRPVADWLEKEDAEPLLARFAAAALDTEEAWSTRRVRLQQTALTSGANAQLLNAAALVVEAYGDVQRARREPFELLLAWRENRDRRFPTMPAELRRAVAAPLKAGAPSEKHPGDGALIAEHALQRALETASLHATARLDGTPLPLRALAAAQSRAQGSGLACTWLLAGPVPAALRTGCRSDERPSGFVVNRPRLQGGFEIVMTAGSDELVLLRWPRWVLFPLVVPGEGSLVFADREGIWSVALDGTAAPRLVAAGEFRRLALGPDGRTIAATRWPSGSLAVIGPGAGVRELGADAGGGLAWLDAELLVATGAAGSAVVSLTGESRPFPAALPCARSLARAGGALLFGAAAPCDTGIVRQPLGEGEVQLALKRGDAPTAIISGPDESVLFADPEGVFRWRAGDAPVRAGGGLTPGPG
jgi:hypothetical protein